MTVILIGAVAGVGVSVWRGATSPSGSGAGSVSGSVDQVDRAVVDITSRLSDGSGVAAGTGMVISSSGEVMTNNHVIRDGARITAQVNGGGPDYPVSVIGVDPVHDVALVQLQGASGLPTVAFADSSVLRLGDPVTALGNALGEGGPPVATSGTVTALSETITVSDEMGGSETLSNLIEMNAQILQGDSGGPLLNSAGKVIGMDTAAQVSGSRRDPTSLAGYAIPSNDALNVVKQIRQGGGGTVQPGNPALLGVAVADTGGTRGSVAVTGVQPGSPADQAGVATGDVITAIDGQGVSTSAQLRDAIRAHKAGDQVRLTWVDTDGQSHAASIKLVAGPPA
jgi:S1-C subfamily serine protease